MHISTCLPSNHHLTPPPIIYHPLSSLLSAPLPLYFPIPIFSNSSQHPHQINISLPPPSSLLHQSNPPHHPLPTFSLFTIFPTILPNHYFTIPLISTTFPLLFIYFFHILFPPHFEFVMTTLRCLSILLSLLKLSLLGLSSIPH